MATKRLTAAITVAAALCCGAPAAAQIKTGHALLQFCTATIGAYVMFCFGYIDSVFDDLRASRNVDGYAACIPDALDDRQRQRIVVDFLRRNPALRGFDATELIARSVAEAFPCR